MHRIAHALAAGLVLAAGSATAEPVASHLDETRDVLVTFLETAVDVPTSEMTGRERRIVRAATRMLEAYVAESSDLKGDLVIAKKMGKQADKFVKLTRLPLDRGLLGPAMLAALALYDADVQARIDDVAAVIKLLPPSPETERAEKLVGKAQKKIGKSRRAPTAVSRANGLNQAGKKVAKAEALVQKARDNAPRPVCVDSGASFGTMSFLYLDADEEQIGLLYDMEDVDAILLASNLLGDGALHITGSIADNPFFDGTSFDAFEFNLVFRDPDVGPYPKTYTVDGPLAGRRDASILWRQDGRRFADARNDAVGTMTLTFFDPITREASGFWDVRVDNVFGTPQRVQGSFQLNCFVDNEIDNK